MGDEVFDVEAHVMCGVGVSGFTSSPHDMLNILAFEENESAQVIASEDTEWVTEWDANRMGASKDWDGEGGLAYAGLMAV
jgi:hypothetical protein